MHHEKSGSFSNVAWSRSRVASSIACAAFVGFVAWVGSARAADDSPVDISGDSGSFQAGNRASPETDSGAEDESKDKELAPQRNFGIFANPVGFLFGILNGDVDYLVTPNVALTVGGSYLNWGIIKGVGFSVGPQFFLQERGFKGFFLLPKVGVSSVSVDYEDVHGSSQLAEVSATAGYQWQFRDGFSIRVGGGLAYYAALSRVDGADSSRYQGLRPVIDGDLGWTF